MAPNYMRTKRPLEWSRISPILMLRIDWKGVLDVIEKIQAKVDGLDQGNSANVFNK